MKIGISIAQPPRSELPAHEKLLFFFLPSPCLFVLLSMAHGTRSTCIVTLVMLVIFVFFYYCDLATVSTDFLSHLLRILLKVLSRGSVFPWDTWQLDTNRFSRSHVTGGFPPWRCLHKSSIVALTVTEMISSVIFSLLVSFFRFLRIPSFSEEMCSRMFLC